MGLDSGAGYLRGCFQSALDLSLSRTIRLAKGRNFQFRVDAFNAPNQAIITARNASMSIASPSTSTVATNLPLDATGNVIPTRAIPAGLRRRERLSGTENNTAAIAICVLTCEGGPGVVPNAARCPG